MSMQFSSQGLSVILLTPLNAYHPETRINELCAELGISRQTLYKHLTPKGELRPLGQKLLDKRKS